MEQLQNEQTLSKADFDELYEQPDPRAYYHGLGALDYQVPHHGQHVFRQVLDALPVEQPTVLDLCCSYGVNAALLKHELELTDLYDHYRSERLADLPTEALLGLDREFYADKRHDSAPEVVGLDSAAPAVDYAVQVGLLDHGASENLEIDNPSAELVDVVGETDLVTVTGGIGYITERTFDRLLECIPPDRQPWVAALCLRTVSFDPIAECLAARGLVTEHLDGVTFPQRRFANDDERAYALNELDARGLEPNGREAEGSYHVNVYLARPMEHVADLPASDLLADLSTTPIAFA